MLVMDNKDAYPTNVLEKYGVVYHATNHLLKVCGDGDDFLSCASLYIGKEYAQKVKDRSVFMMDKLDGLDMVNHQLWKGELV